MPAPAAPALCASEDAPTSPQEDAASIVPRLQGAVERVLPAIEAIVGRLGGPGADAREMERAGRALGALMRTLRELNALLRQDGGSALGARNDDNDMPADIDEFRLALARRIHALVDSREAQKAAAEAAERAEGEEPEGVGVGG